MLRWEEPSDPHHNTPMLSNLPATASSRPLAVITGASEGIGRDLAAIYAREGYDLLIVARREDLLQSLASDLRSKYGVVCRSVVADLAHLEGCESVVRAAEPDQSRVAALVNNAGLGSLGRFHETAWARDEVQIDLNITALTYLTKCILPWLRTNGGGHVMNLASVAAFQPGPLMAVYYASKAYVLSLSEALHNECIGTGITVSAVCPGPTTTGFRRVSGGRVDYRSGWPPAMSSLAVAELAYRGTKAGKPVVITGFSNKVAAFLGRHGPSGGTAAFVRRVQERRLASGE